MLARRRARALVSGALLALGAIGFVGCNLDWSVRPDPVDGGAPPDRDAAADVKSDRFVGENADGSVSPDASEAGTTCPALTAELDGQWKAARACSFQIGECSETVKDPCNCDLVVARTNSAETAAYLATVAKIKGAGCASGCAACPSTTPRSCLSKATGVIECFPP